MSTCGATKLPNVYNIPPRLLAVWRLVAQGYTNATIARLLFLSPRTVGRHMERIYERCGIQGQLHPGVIEKRVVATNRYNQMKESF